jgi:hypothetical protein
MQTSYAKPEIRTNRMAADFNFAVPDWGENDFKIRQSGFLQASNMEYPMEPRHAAIWPLSVEC